MSIKLNFERMAAYNRWMNRKIYRSAAQLSEVELHADRKAFFGSVFGTLNHILVADTLWMKRFAGHPSNFNALQAVRGLEAPSSLSQILHADLAQLEKARWTMDEAIIRMCSEADDDDFIQSLRYVTTSGQACVDDFAILVQHFFNHQTHHRGQVTTLLSQSGIDVGATDLVLMLREQSGSPQSNPEGGGRG